VREQSNESSAWTPRSVPAASYARPIIELDTAFGRARVHVHPVKQPRAALVLGHGAGGGIAAPDLVAATHGAHSVGLSVALVEQPYRVAGRRSPAPARQLDGAWSQTLAQLREHTFAELPIVAGGRSSGARVACRTAADVGAVALLCLAFPLHPPGRGDDPSKSRLPELDALALPTLVVQGDRDPFGMPPEGPNRTVVRVPGDHSLRNSAAVSAAVADWLPIGLIAGGS
jgi:predicted alpha/beta-hydrolase family hydrolase